MSIDQRIEALTPAPLSRQSEGATQGDLPDNIGLLPAMLRTWSAAREIGENPLPHMTRKAGTLCPSPEVAVACASLFALAEAVMGRVLVPECCCSKALSRDEYALLTLLRSGPDARTIQEGRGDMPGLVEALCWAMIGVRRALQQGGGLETRH
jgi:hypothetical protein